MFVPPIISINMVRTHRRHCWLLVFILVALVLPASGVGTVEAQSESKTFTETGKTITGRFLQYWEAHGGLSQQGFPISDEFTEISDLNGQPYLVQYFERAVFEMHPENPEASRVLLSQLGTFRNQEKSTVGGWAALPYPVPPASSSTTPPAPPTPTTRPQPPAQPTQPPAPPASTDKIVIDRIFYDGAEPRSEGDEYAAIKNVGSSAVNLQGYRLNAGNQGQDFRFPSFTLNAGAEVRVYTNRDIAGSFFFNRSSAIWNNDGDCGYLYDPQGNEVSRKCY